MRMNLTHLRWFVAPVLALVLTGSAAAYSHITQDGTQYSQPVTAYIGDPDLYALCRTQPGGPSDYDCYGSDNTQAHVLDIGDAAVHWVSNPQDPVARYGTLVRTQGVTISLRYRNGTYRTADYYFIHDTGGGGDWWNYNAWLDIYCGDALSQAAHYNRYYLQNRTTVETNFGSSTNNNLRFNLYFDVPPITI